MSETTYSWGNNRRFNAYANYFRKEFGERVQKVSIDAGFTCPNRDGTLGQGGCTYCNNDAFSPSYCSKEKSISQQIQEGIEFHRKRYRRAKKYLAYFQAYSNTYAPLKKLKNIYDEAMGIPGVVGLVIGTRPDCVDREKLDYFKKLAERIYLIIEYGIESCYNETLKRINRKHSFEQSVEAIRETANRGIRAGGHIIFGLPGETRKQMLEEAEILSKLPLNNIKFHQLQIIKGTQMEIEYKNNPEAFQLFSLEEYMEFIIRFIERINPEFVVERFTGEVHPDMIAGPRWFMKRTDQILAMVEERMEELNTWQGKEYNQTGNE